MNRARLRAPSRGLCPRTPVHALVAMRCYALPLRPSLCAPPSLCSVGVRRRCARVPPPSGGSAPLPPLPPARACPFGALRSFASLTPLAPLRALPLVRFALSRPLFSVRAIRGSLAPPAVPPFSLVRSARSLVRCAQVLTAMRLAPCESTARPNLPAHHTPTPSPCPLAHPEGDFGLFSEVRHDKNGSLGDYAPTPFGGSLKFAHPLDSWRCYAFQLSPWSFGRCRACPRSINVIWSCLLARYRLHICTCACVLCPYGHRPTDAGCRKGSPPFAPRSRVPRPLLPLGCSLRSHRATVVAALAHR